MRRPETGIGNASQRKDQIKPAEAGREDGNARACACQSARRGRTSGDGYNGRPASRKAGWRSTGREQDAGHDAGSSGVHLEAAHGINGVEGDADRRHLREHARENEHTEVGVTAQDGDQRAPEFARRVRGFAGGRAFRFARRRREGRSRSSWQWPPAESRAQN